MLDLYIPIMHLFVQIVVMTRTPEPRTVSARHGTNRTPVETPFIVCARATDVENGSAKDTPLLTPTLASVRVWRSQLAVKFY